MAFENWERFVNQTKADLERAKQTEGKEVERTVERQLVNRVSYNHRHTHGRKGKQ